MAAKHMGAVSGLARSTAGGPSKAMLWVGQTAVALATRKGAEAHFINNQGQVVGRYLDDLDNEVTFFWQFDERTELGIGTPTGLNERGEVLVSAAPDSLVWHDGKKKAVLPFHATDINEHGQVVGQNTIATVWKDGRGMMAPS